MSDIVELVVFKLCDEHYGIDIHNVENIEKVMPITRVPYTERYVEGVVNLRGNIIPIIDLRSRFKLEKIQRGDDARIIIVKVNDIRIGMIVDSSSEVLQLEKNQIDSAPSIKGNIDEDYITHIGKNDGRIVMLLDLEKVLGIEEAAAE